MFTSPQQTWLKEKVYDYFATTQDPPWSRAQVDMNFNNFVSTRYTDEDPIYRLLDSYSQSTQDTAFPQLQR